MRLGGLRVAVLASTLLAAPAIAAPAATATATRSAAPARVAPTADDRDPKLTANLDAVMANAPADTCLTVSIGGEPAYRHAGDQPLVPASTEKLLTATVALDQLGAETRFRTTVVGAAPNADGVVTGDLGLVGGGDPVLVTDAYRFIRRIGDDQPTTSLDALADRVAASGIRGVTGRVLGDESRFDTLRYGPTWPDRYASQEQSGPLSALDVDDGYDLVLPTSPDGEADRDPSPAPAASAARTFTALLRARGVLVVGDGAAGVAPAGATELGRAESPPVAEIVGQMLRASDNQIAELLTKEIGRRSGAGGSTTAGAAAIAARAGELGLTTSATRIVDGSGLDPANRATCDELVEVLDASGGLAGTLGPSLPVAGESGTLVARFRGNPAEGRLHAKTGSLSQVSALAGFVSLPSGEVATFAYLANGAPVDAKVRGAEDLLGAVLGTYVPPCRDVATGPLVAPLAPYAAAMSSLAMFPLQSVLLPGAVVPLHVFEDRYRALVERCLAADEDFGVVLISRGSEVGGGDVRTDVGTRARIVQAEHAPDGRWAVLALGMARLRVTSWLPDDPYPVAEVEDWPDPEPGSETEDRLLGTGARLRRVLALRAELGEPGPSPTVPLDVPDPTLASFHLASLAPLGDLDRHRILASPNLDDRLARLDGLLDEEEESCRARLAGT